MIQLQNAGRVARRSDQNEERDDEERQNLQLVHLFTCVKLAIVFDEVPMLLRCSKRAPMRQYPRQTIHTDKLPAWAGVQLRPLFVSRCSPHFSHPSLTGRRCRSQEPMSERDLTRHVCRVLSFAVVRYRSGLLKRIASSEKSLQLYRLVSKKTSYKPVYVGQVCARWGGRNWKESCPVVN
jgi:hypothetical protein